MFGWWLWNVFQVRTTNAYVVGNITPVSSDVGGQVVALYADDNMIVAAGAPLAQLDPVPFQLEVDRVLADLHECTGRGGALQPLTLRLVRQDRRAARPRRCECTPGRGRAGGAAGVGGSGSPDARDRSIVKEKELLASGAGTGPWALAAARGENLRG